MTNPQVLEHVFDVKAWLQPHLHKLHNHSHRHIFRFTQGTTGRVVMHCKDWNESEWEPSDNGIDLFKVYNFTSLLISCITCKLLLLTEFSRRTPWSG